jgi:hypothetical protein
MCRVKGLPVLRSVAPHRFASSRSRRLAGLTLLAALAVSPALSQPPNAGGFAGNAGGANQPGVSPAPLGGQPGGEQPPAELSPAAQALKEIDDAPPDEQPKLEGPELPEDFHPPGQIPEVFTLRKPLMTDEEIAKEENDLRRYNTGRGVETVLRLGDPSNENKQALKRWARMLAAKMTAVKEWRELNDIASTQLLNIRNAALSQTNDARRREFREAMCAAMTESLSGVLDNNFYVRLQAVNFLSQLDVIPESQSGRDRRPPETYVPAMQPLLKVLADSEQPEAVKVRAAAGVGRIAEYAQLIPAELKFQAADVLTKELAREDTHYWYQMRLTEALAALEFDYNRNRQPIVIDGLMAVIADKNRHCMARTAAAKALARTRLPAGAFNDKAAADRIVRLAHEMSLDYNKNLSRVHWVECYANLYMAFVPADQNELQRLPNDSLLRRGTLPAAMNDAQQRIRPVVSHVLGQKRGQRPQPIPQEMIQRLNDFLALANQN